MTLRLTFLIPSETTGGAVPGIARELVHGLEARDDSVRVLNWGSRSHAESTFAKIAQRPVDAWRLARHIAAQPVDVLVVHSGMDWKTVLRDLLLCLLVRRHVTSIVIEPHGGRADWIARRGHSVFRLFVRALFRSIDGLFVLSTQEREVYSQLSPGLLVRHVRNPLSNPGDFTRANLDSGGPLRLLFVGRIVPGKGLLECIRAMSLGPPDALLRVAGSGSELRSAEAEVRKLGLAEQVQFLGHLDRQELAAAYTDSHVLLLPTSLPEGFPTVLMEAMASGLGIITTKIRGAADHLSEGRNALFVEAGSAESLAAAIQMLDIDRALLQRMGSANAEDSAKFAREDVVTEYHAALREIFDASSA